MSIGALEPQIVLSGDSQGLARSHSARSEAFRHDIEGLRGIAVLIVVLFHAGVPLVRGGFVGVDAFFVLSGYLITGLLLQEHKKYGTIRFTHFYARRMRRLLPAATLALVATVFAGIMLYSPIEQLRYAPTAIATASYASNAWLLLHASNYFSPAVATNPFLHTWSLAVEEQFYLVWPLLIFLGLGRTHSRRRLTLTLGALTVVSGVLCIWLTDVAAVAAFYSTPIRAWEFGVGGLLSLVPPARIAKSAGQVLGWLGVVGLGAIAAVFSEATHFPGAAAIAPVLATAAVLLPAHSGRPGKIGQLLEFSPLQWLGKYSYAWYLWHWPVLIFGLAVAPALTVYGRLLLAVGALLIAIVSYHVLEQPARTNRWLVRSPGRSIALGAALSTVGVLAGAIWFGAAKKQMLRPDQRSFYEAALSSSPIDAPRCLPPARDAVPRECVFGDLASPVLVLAIGDSHLAHWYPALDALGKAQHWRMVSLVKSGCPTASLPVFLASYDREYHECATWRDKVVRRVQRIRPAGVILANSHFVEVTKGIQASPAQWESGIRSTIINWDSLGVPTALIADNPSVLMDAPLCLSRVASHSWYPAEACSRPRGDAIDAGQTAAFENVARTLKHVAVVNLNDLICPGVRCPSALSGTVIYKDNTHLNAAFVRLLAPAFAARVAPVFGRDPSAPIQAP